MHFDPIVLVLLDVLIVMGLSRTMGMLFSQIKQPLVIGEIVAGVMLGPSLLGMMFPAATAVLNATRSAQIVRPYEACSTLQPLMISPDSVSKAAPTRNFEYGACACARAAHAQRISSEDWSLVIGRWFQNDQ